MGQGELCGPVDILFCFKLHLSFYQDVPHRITFIASSYRLRGCRNFTVMVSLL